jgi:hypothetical protein
MKLIAKHLLSFQGSQYGPWFGKQLERKKHIDLEPNFFFLFFLAVLVFELRTLCLQADTIPPHCQPKLFFNPHILKEVYANRAFHTKLGLYVDETNLEEHLAICIKDLKNIHALLAGYFSLA